MWSRQSANTLCEYHKSHHGPPRQRGESCRCEQTYLVRLAWVEMGNSALALGLGVWGVRRRRSLVYLRQVLAPRFAVVRACSYRRDKKCSRDTSSPYSASSPSDWLRNLYKILRRNMRSEMIAKSNLSGQYDQDFMSKVTDQSWLESEVPQTSPRTNEKSGCRTHL
jgi:hypothetical protein